VLNKQTTLGIHNNSPSPAVGAISHPA
jgi:hypothetical protein